MQLRGTLDQEFCQIETHACKCDSDINMSISLYQIDTCVQTYVIDYFGSLPSITNIRTGRKLDLNPLINPHKSTWVHLIHNILFQN